MRRKWSKTLPPIPRGSVRIETSQGKYADLNEHNVLNYQNGDTLSYNKQLRVHKETDQNFIRDVKNIAKVGRNMFLQIIKDGIPQLKLTENKCDELDYLAKRHAKANKVNQNSRVSFENIEEADRCLCGCDRGKGQHIPLCMNEQKLDFLGPGVLLQFFFNKVTFVFLLFLVLIYGIYGTVTNLQGSEAVSHHGCQGDRYCIFKVLVSDENKKGSGSLERVQEWLGLGFCVFWIFALRILKFIGKEKNKIIDKKLKSSSDFAIKVSNLPRGKYEEGQLINYLQDLWKMTLSQLKAKQAQKQQKLSTQSQPQSQSPSPSDPKLQIKAIHIIYDLEPIRKLVEQLFQQAKQIDDYLQSDPMGDKKKNIVRNREKYLSKKERLIETYEILLDLRKRFVTDGGFRRGLASTSCILVFENAGEQRKFLGVLGREKIGLLKTIKLRILKCLFPDKEITLFKGKLLKIERSPEPSDLLWKNCQKPESVLRKLAIFLISFLIMLLSFSIILGLQYLQNYLENHPKLFSRSQVQTVVNILTSIALLAINSLLWFLMSKLLDFEYNHTETDKIISQMNKVLLLSSINVIVLPILGNYFTERADRVGAFLYGNRGLAGLTFDYQVSSLVSVIKGLFPTMTIIKTVALCIRFVRRYIIRFLVRDSLSISQSKGSQKVNQFYEGPDFDIAQNYITLIMSILHAAFFCPLQPILLFIVSLMTVFFFIVNKIKLLRICKIPTMTEYLVFDNAIYLLGFLPIYFGVGSIVVKYFQRGAMGMDGLQVLASLIAIGLGVLGLANPKDFLNRIIAFVFAKCPCINLQIFFKNHIQQSQSNSSASQSQQSSSHKMQSSENSSLCLPKRPKNQNNRQESYYENSNMLALFAFELTLKGEEGGQLQGEVRNYCQGFFSRNLQLTKGLRDITNSVMDYGLRTEGKGKGEKVFHRCLDEENSTKSLKAQSQKQNF